MPPAKRDMTITEAVKFLPGMSAATLKKWLRDAYMMKARPCPFADAVITEKGEWQFYIWPDRLHAYRHAHDLILRKELPEYERNHMGGLAVTKMRTEPV